MRVPNEREGLSEENKGTERVSGSRENVVYFCLELTESPRFEQFPS